MRRTRSRLGSRQVDLYPRTRTCPACQQPLRERYRKRRFIVRLREQLDVTSHFLECPRSGCEGRGVVYRPEDEGLLALRGYTFGLDVVAAIGHYRQALRAKADATAAFNLGTALEELGRWASAIESYQRAIDTDGALADAHFNLARLCERVGQREEAIRHLREYRRLVKEG